MKKLILFYLFFLTLSIESTEISDDAFDKTYIANEFRMLTDIIVNNFNYLQKAELLSYIKFWKTEYLTNYIHYYFIIKLLDFNIAKLPAKLFLKIRLLIYKMIRLENIRREKLKQILDLTNRIKAQYINQQYYKIMCDAIDTEIQNIKLLDKLLSDIQVKIAIGDDYEFYNKLINIFEAKIQSNMIYFY